MFKNIILISSYALIFFSHINYSDDQHYKEIQRELKMVRQGHHYDEDRQEKQTRKLLNTLMGIWFAVAMGLSGCDVVSRELKAIK